MCYYLNVHFQGQRVKELRKKSRPSRTFKYTEQFFYNPVGATHTCYIQWTVRKNHSILHTSWATGHQPPGQLKILPPTQWTRSSMPRSARPRATRLRLSRSRPTHKNSPLYFKTTSSPDSDLHTSKKKILTILLLDTGGVPRGGLGGFNPPRPPPKSRSFDEVEPDCKLSGKCSEFIFQHPN